MVKRQPRKPVEKREYSSKYSREVIFAAKKLYFVLNEDLQSLYSMNRVVELLKQMYPTDCNKMNKATLSRWIAEFQWDKQREAAVRHAFDEAEETENLQRTYNIHVFKKHQLRLSEIKEFLNKPSAASKEDVVKGLKEEEKQLIDGTAERLGMVLVELRSLNGSAFNSLIKRNKVTGNLLLPHVNRSEAWKEYTQSLELLIKLYSAQLVGQLVGKAAGMSSPFGGGKSPAGSPQLPGGVDIGSMSDDVLRRTQLVLPDEVLKNFMQQLAGGMKFDENSATNLETIDSTGESHTGRNQPAKPYSGGSEEDN